MKYVKMLGLAAIAAAALMAFVGASTASATVLCTTKTNEGKCPLGWAYTGEIHAVSEEPSVFTGGFKNVQCNESTINWSPESEGSATETVKGPVAALTFTGECNCSYNVVKPGRIEVHWTSGANGTLTYSGTTLTALCSTIFGNVHCNYVTENTHFGTLAGSSMTGGTATIDITAEIPNEQTSGLCSSISVWHAKYKVTTPDYLDVAQETG